MVHDDEPTDDHCDRAACFADDECECVCVGCVAAKCRERGEVMD